MSYIRNISIHALHTQSGFVGISDYHMLKSVLSAGRPSINNQRALFSYEYDIFFGLAPPLLFLSLLYLDLHGPGLSSISLSHNKIGFPASSTSLSLCYLELSASFSDLLLLGFYRSATALASSSAESLSLFLSSTCFGSSQRSLPPRP